MSDERKVRALATIRASGQRLEVGKVYTVSNRDADFLCQIGRCEEVIKKAREKGPMTTKKASATIAGK